MSPYPSNEKFASGDPNLKNNIAASPIKLNLERPVFMQFLRPASSDHSLYIGKNKEGLVLTLRKADPLLVQELLRFMLSKNWIEPCSEIMRFLKNEQDHEIGENKNLTEFHNKTNKDKKAGYNILNTDNPFLQSVNNVIEAHLDDECFRPYCLSKKIFLCEMQLHRKLKKIVNLSPSNYIRKYRLLRSQVFLKKTQSSISEICYMVGFNSLQYFSRSFKKEFGVSPSRFKRQMLK